jgi:nucleotide-binding universal stress UspA family protein
VPERVVLESGRPTLMIPYAGDFERVGGRVLVAWNATREAARAVADTLPLLVRAEQVVVLEIDPAEGRMAPGPGLVAHLRRHGVEAEARHTVSAGIALGEILLSTIADAGSDLLVMGAYGHSRVHELALGGVTRTILEEMTIPVVMSY